MSPGMDEKSREEREFAKRVDEFLAGKEIKIDETLDEQYRSNVDFSRKIVECRGEPSPSFQEGLKKRLLSKLADQEAAKVRQRSEHTSFWDWLRNLVPHSPAWKTAAVTVTIVVLALVVWRTGLFSPSEEPMIQTGLAIGPAVAVEGRAISTKTTYTVGEEIDIQFSFRNITDDTLTFPFPPEIRIEDANIEAVKTFAVGQGTRTLAPGQSIQYDLVWDQKDTTGKQVPPGDYQVVLQNIEVGEGKGVVSLVESPVLTISANP